MPASDLSAYMAVEVCASGCLPALQVVLVGREADDEGEGKMSTYHVIVTVEVPNVEAEDIDEAINFVTETIEDGFAQPVQFCNQTARKYGE